MGLNKTAYANVIQKNKEKQMQLECGPMPNVMVALPNIGGAVLVPSVQRRKVWLTPTTRVPSSNAAKTRKPLKFAGVPQTRQQTSAVSRPKFTILWGHVEEVLWFLRIFLNFQKGDLDHYDHGQTGSE